MTDTPTRITLSDGSVWEYAPRSADDRDSWLESQSGYRYPIPFRHTGSYSPLAPDHRKIADAMDGDHPDTALLDWLLSHAELRYFEGDIWLFIGGLNNDRQWPVAIVAECDSDGNVTEAAAPWLTAEQRAHLNGTAPDAQWYIDDPTALRAAIDAARRSHHE